MTVSADGEGDGDADERTVRTLLTRTVKMLGRRRRVWVGCIEAMRAGRLDGYAASVLGEELRWRRRRLLARS